MNRSRLALIGLAYIAFIGLGLPDGLTGVAWPSMRTDFALPLDALGTLLAAVVVGYLSASFASGWLLARMSIGVVLAASCALTGISLVGYTLVPTWWAMLLASSLGLALGQSMLDSILMQPPTLANGRCNGFMPVTALALLSVRSS